MSYEDALKWVEWEENSIRNDARRDGLEEGKAEGKEETMILMIKNMVDKNFSLDDISSVTGKSIDEINKYIK